MPTPRPNFLVVVADDLGYSDIGCYGSEIKTPTLDALAADGIRFSDFHTAPTCSPTRSMLMSGTDNHIAGVGAMREHLPSDPERWNRAGHEGYLNLDVAALPELLSDAGYFTLMSGKWHLGLRNEHMPHSRGFAKSWSFLPGAGNHFGWEPAYTGGDLDPPRPAAHLPLIYVENGVLKMPEPNLTNSPDGFYSSDAFADKIVTLLQERSKDEKTKPFFAYLPFTAPHWPLQCHKDDADAYKGRYNEGPDALRLERLARLAKMDLIPSDCTPHEVVSSLPTWTDTDPSRIAISTRAMEIYAGMITSLDRALGRVVQALKAQGELDNTFILFMSDNGAEGALHEAATTMGDKDKLHAMIGKYYNNDLENLGNHNSFVTLGDRWAQASTAPHRMHKGFTTEGGIRVPCLVRYPAFHSGGGQGGIFRQFTTCMDIMPTILELAGAVHPNIDPKTPRSKAPYRGRQVFSMRGRSLVKDLGGGVVTSTQESTVPVGWELHGRAALRLGKWKIVHLPAAAKSGTGEWQLYDVERDQGETLDLARTHPDILENLKTLFDNYATETNAVFDPGHKPSPAAPDYDWSKHVSGDWIEDQRAWTRIGEGGTRPSTV